MSRQFKVGDKIRCKVKTTPYTEVGKCYVISEVHYKYPEHFRLDNNLSWWYLNKDFELAKPPKNKPGNFV